MRKIVDYLALEFKLFREVFERLKIILKAGFGGKVKFFDSEKSNRK
jgi:hypothetical protein